MLSWLILKECTDSKSNLLLDLTLLEFLSDLFSFESLEVLISFNGFSSDTLANYY